MYCYCPSCARKRKYVQNVPINDSLGSTYQFGKFIKHITPSTCYQMNSVFITNSTSAYDKYYIDAYNFGSVEIDNSNRMNIIYFAGKQTGNFYLNGILQFPTDSIKLVLSTDVSKSHIYPDSSTNYSTAFCSDCGIKIPK